MSFRSITKQKLRHPNVHTQRGFSLLETIVAIAVLTVGVTAPLVIAQKALHATQLAKQEISAYYLIQESIEHIKTIRDTNSLAGDDWLEGLSSCIGGECTIDTTTDTITVCGGGGCPALRYDDATAQFGYNGSWEETFFTRTIEMTELSSTEVAVDVTISWPTNLTTESITIRENLHDFLNSAITIDGGTTLIPSSPIILSISQHEQDAQADTVTWEHIQEYSNASNKVLLIFLAYNDLGSATVSSVTYTNNGNTINAGQILSRVVANDPAFDSSNTILEVWSVPNSSLLTTIDEDDSSVEISFSSDIRGGSFGATMLANVESTPDDTDTNTESNFSNPTNENYSATAYPITIAENNSILIEAMVGLSYPTCDPLIDSDKYCYNGLGPGLAGESPVDEIVTFSQFGDIQNRYLPDLIVTHSFVDLGTTNADWELKPQDGYIFGRLVFQSE